MSCFPLKNYALDWNFDLKIWICYWKKTTNQLLLTKFRYRKYKFMSWVYLKIFIFKLLFFHFWLQENDVVINNIYQDPDMYEKPCVEWARAVEVVVVFHDECPGSKAPQFCKSWAEWQKLNNNIRTIEHGFDVLKKLQSDLLSFSSLWRARTPLMR